MKEKIPFIEVVAYYCMSSMWRNLSSRSQKIYSNGLDTLNFLNNIPIKDIKRRDVLDFVDRMHNSPGKCREALAVLNNVFRYAYDRGWVEHNPCRDIRGLPSKKPYPRWEEWEVDKFITTAHPRLRHAFMLALYTGQRKSDLVRMKWDDYDGKFIHVVQRKTGKELYIPVHPKLRRALKEMREDISQRKRLNPYILKNMYGDPLSPGSFSRAVTQHARKIGLVGKCIHGIRKTTASILAEAGCSVWEIAAITGHSSVRELEAYAAGREQRRLAQSAVQKWEQNHVQ